MSAAALRDSHGLGGALRFGPGRKAEPLRVAFDRELSVEDLLAAQTSELTQAFRPVLKLRQRHHQLARVLAQGITDQEASAVTGYDPAYISGIRGCDPAFKDLLNYYKDMEAEQYTVARADMHERLSALGHDSLSELHERLELTPEVFTIKDLRAIVEATADRTGFGKTSTVNHEHTHSLSAETIARVKQNANVPAVVAEDDRQSLLRLAARGTAVELPETGENDWIEGEGRLVREEGDQAPEEEVASRGDPLSQVD